MIISIVKNWSLVETEHKDFLRGVFTEYFYNFLKGNSKNSLCYSFLRRNYRYIISSNKDLYIKSIELFHEEVEKNNDFIGFESEFKKQIAKVLNYELFVKKDKAKVKVKYNAYSLCMKSKSKTCPYCNHSYAFSIQRFNKGFRPTLDHFYDKASYPHLALSLYNLVPACYSCNSSLKGSADFYLNEHLHPLFDDECFTFTLNHKSDEFKNPDELLVEKASVLKLDISSKSTKEKNTLKTFLIEERYESFVNDALLFAQCKKSFDNLKLNDQIKITHQMREETSLRFNKNNYKNEMLGKLYFDIYNQFG